MLETST